MEKRVSTLESKVNDMTLTDRVAQLLADKLAERRRLELSLWQKIGAGAFSVFLVAVGALVTKALT